MVKLRRREVKRLDQVHTLSRQWSQGQHPNPLWVSLLLCDSATIHLGGLFRSLQSELTALLSSYSGPHLPISPWYWNHTNPLCITQHNILHIQIFKKYFWKPLVNNKSTANDLWGTLYLQNKHTSFICTDFLSQNFYLDIISKTTVRNVPFLNDPQKVFEPTACLPV